MKSKVTQLYDMRQVSIPAELRKWRVSEEEVQAQLARIAAAHPMESKPHTVEPGDSVLCRTTGADARWNREALPFYPGRNMLPEVEAALIGMQVGETREAGDKTLTVLEITRRRPAPLTDALIAEEGIENVSTIAQYEDWWRALTEQDRKRTAIQRLIFAIQQEMIQNSVFACDEEELNGIAREMAQKQYAAMVKAGIDPTVPDEGVDFLTEEEALKRIARENRMRLLGCVLNEYYATVLYPITREEYNASIVELGRSMNKNREELIAYAGEFLVDDYVYNQVFSREVSRFAETLLED